MPSSTSNTENLQTQQKENERNNNNKTTSQHKNDLEKENYVEKNRASEYYSFLSAFDCIIILINSIYYVLLLFVCIQSKLGYKFTNLNKNTHILRLWEPV